MSWRYLVLGLVAASGLLAVPAAAKDCVHAELLNPVSLDTAAGKRIRLDWRLVDHQGGSFGASGIYVRVSRCGRAPLVAVATSRGSWGYTARLTAPKGGIREIVVGLRGWRVGGGGKTQRADVFLPFEPPLVSRRRCPD